MRVSGGKVRLVGQFEILAQDNFFRAKSVQQDNFLEILSYWTDLSVESLVAIKIPIKNTSQNEKQNLIVYQNIQIVSEILQPPHLVARTAFSGQTALSGQVFELPKNPLNAVWILQKGTFHHSFELASTDFIVWIKSTAIDTSR